MRQFDPEAMRAVVLAVVRKLVPAADDKLTPQMIEMMKQISFDMKSETTIDVEGGIARAAAERETITASLMGHSMNKLETRTVKVTSLP